MTVPQWTLLGFTAWTLLLLAATVGVYRWGMILLRGARVGSFRSDRLEGAPWYQRGTRAHANCIENLPVFGAIVFALYVGQVGGPLVDALCVVVLVARVLQSLVHVCFTHSNAVASWRFTFFFTQFICFAWLIGLIVARHGMPT